MKKIILIFLAAIMTLSLVGCNNNNDNTRTITDCIGDEVQR